jgi:hypothetical protein
VFKRMYQVKGENFDHICIIKSAHKKDPLKVSLDANISYIPKGKVEVCRKNFVLDMELPGI